MKKLNKSIEEIIEDFNPYCDVCGGCGYIDCCGIRRFLKHHVEGKTNCKQESGYIYEIISQCEFNEEKIRESNKDLINKFREIIGDDEKIILIASSFGIDNTKILNRNELRQSQRQQVNELEKELSIKQEDKE